MRTSARVAGLLLAALALAACGSSSSASSSTSASQPPSGPTSSSSSAPTSTGAASSTHGTSTPAGSSTRCDASRLAVSFLGQQGATGHGLLGFALKNTSTTSCHTFGYPGVLFLGRAGQALPTSSTRTTSDVGGSSKLTGLTVAPGQSASFRLVVTHFTAGGGSAGCTTAYGLQVIAPDDTARMRVTIPGGAYECGTTTVSPLQAGTSAYR